jgi:uncharacterized membrane protein
MSSPTPSASDSRWKIVRITQFANVLLIALVSGVLWGTWFSLGRSIETFSADVFLSIGQAMIHNLAVPMRVLMPLTMVSFIVLLYLLWHQRTSKAFVLTAAALFFMLATIAITLIVEVPIDNQIKTWTVHTLPANWQALRSHWEAYHTLRTMTGLVSLGCAVAGAFLSRSVSKKG